MAWLILIIAGLFEIAGTLSLKLAQGLTRPLPSLSLFVCMGLSLYLLSTAVQAAIPIGTAYAIWTGIGAVGTALVGMIGFRESRAPWRIASLGLVILGSMGMKFFGH